MSFSQMVRSLREGNKGTIIFINAGAFYIAVEEDTIGDVVQLVDFSQSGTGLMQKKKWGILMNDVFLIGKLIEDVEYKFMLQKRKNSKSKT